MINWFCSLAISFLPSHSFKLKGDTASLIAFRNWSTVAPSRPQPKPGTPAEVEFVFMNYSILLQKAHFPSYVRYFLGVTISEIIKSQKQSEYQ